MQCTTQDQCVLLRSVVFFFNQLISSHHWTPAKNLVVASQNRRLAIQPLPGLSVSNTAKKGPKPITQIPTAGFVLKSFGNTLQFQRLTFQ